MIWPWIISNFKVIDGYQMFKGSWNYERELISCKRRTVKYIGSFVALGYPIIINHHHLLYGWTFMGRSNL